MIAAKRGEADLRAARTQRPLTLLPLSRRRARRSTRAAIVAQARRTSRLSLTSFAMEAMFAFTVLVRVWSQLGVMDVLHMCFKVSCAFAQGSCSTHYQLTLFPKDVKWAAVQQIMKNGNMMELPVGQHCELCWKVGEDLDVPVAELKSRCAKSGDLRAKYLSCRAAREARPNL